MLGQLIMSGLATGSLYALTAVAVVVVFRNTRTINLAQGDFAMIGAFLALIFIKSFGFDYLFALGLSVVCTMALGVLTERLVMRPIADSSWLTLFTATLGVYYILHGVSGWLWGRDTKAFPITFDPTPIHFLGTIISEGHLINMAWVTAIGVLLFLFFRYTKQGIAMRAVTDDPETAQLMGIPLNKVYSIAWAIGGAMAAIAGILLAPRLFLSTNMGHLTFIAIIACIIGGFGNLFGAIVGGYLLGILQTVLPLYIPQRLQGLIPYALLIIVLFVRPTGILGKAMTKKV